MTDGLLAVNSMVIQCYNNATLLLPLLLIDGSQNSHGHKVKVEKGHFKHLNQFDQLMLFRSFQDTVSYSPPALRDAVKTTNLTFKIRFFLHIISKKQCY